MGSRQLWQRWWLKFNKLFGRQNQNLTLIFNNYAVAFYMYFNYMTSYFVVARVKSGMFLLLYFLIITVTYQTQLHKENGIGCIYMKKEPINIFCKIMICNEFYKLNPFEIIIMISISSYKKACTNKYIFIRLYFSITCILNFNHLNIEIYNFCMYSSFLRRKWKSFYWNLKKNLSTITCIVISVKILHEVKEYLN